MVVGILFIISFLFIAVSGIWGTLTRNIHMVSSFASSWVCVLILVIIVACVHAAALASCGSNDTFVDCADDPWRQTYPRYVFYALFALVSAIIGYALAANMRNSNKNDNCC